MKKEKQYKSEKLSLELNAFITRIQLKNLRTFLILALFFNVIVISLEIYEFWDSWSSNVKIVYSAVFGILDFFFIVSYLIVRRFIKKRPSEKKIALLIYSVMYFTVFIIFISPFIAGSFSDTLYFIALTQFIVSLGLFLSNKERGIYVLYTFILYLILLTQHETKLESPFLMEFSKITTYSFSMFFLGKLIYDSYLQVQLKSIELKYVINSQKETLKFLSEELDVSRFDFESGESLEKLDKAIKNMLVEFGESKKELKLALELAEQASQVKEAFLASMSHEIRAPLNTIIGMVRELSKGDLTEQQQQFLKNTNAASEHLMSLVDNVLDITKIEAGEIKIIQNHFNVSGLMDNMISMMMGKAADKNVLLTSRFDEKIPKALYGDASRIRQILFNVIGNAIKYTDEGEIDISVVLKEVHQDIYHIQFIIRDTGIGIGKPFLAKIFDKFSRERKVETIRSGTGLGLAITRDIIDLMNGKIDISSELNKGTTVDICLPMKKGNEKKIYDYTDAFSKTKIRNKVVLLVEDDRMNRLIAARSLHGFGLEVEEASNGKEAIEMCTRRKYDLIVMDINMPVLNGVEATKTIRNELKIDTPIIALTANAFKNDIDKYLEVGMNGYVTKPYNEQYLYNKVLEMMNIKVAKKTLTEKMYSAENIKQMGDDTFVNNIFKIFYAELEISIKQITIAIQKEDYNLLYLTVHKILPNVKQLAITAAIDDMEVINSTKEKEWDKVSQDKAICVLGVLKKVKTQLSIELD